ncbi:MAG TPA: PhzF family phenazine biosynthesis protein [Pseudonocardiaceae bacterium]|nr:PhzF family phenazine biosynthesis protein [Pseudonocardiaceae bacterium]
MRFYWVDAFTGAAFRGNAAVVCLLDEELPDHRLALIAAEFNQPVTAFLRSGPFGFVLRWFTPTQELALCGHGTLAAAYALYEAGLVPADQPIEFSAPNDQLVATREAGRIWLDFPRGQVSPASAPPAALAALGVAEAVWFGRNDFEYVVELESAEQVAAVRPDFGQVLALPASRLVVTAAGGPGADFTSRVFVPALGINEDQVTGSAHAVLGPLWADRLGRTELTAVQASARGGELALRVLPDKVRLGGQAVLIGQGELLVAGVPAVY